MLGSTVLRKSIFPKEAFCLQGSCLQILECLGDLGNGTLVMRRHGLSLAKKTGFGSAWDFHGDDIFSEKISGLKLCSSISQQIYLLPCPDDGRPVLAIGVAGQPVDISIHWNDLTWDSSEIQELIRRFDGLEMKRSESWRLAANAWLDEWAETDRNRETGSRFREEIIQAFQQCELLEVEVETGRHRCVVTFNPSFIDFEGSVLRVADQSRNHVIFLDLASAAFRIKRLSPTHLRIGKPVETIITPTLISHPAA